LISTVVSLKKIMQLQFLKLDPLAQLPTYQTTGASGFDFHSVEKAILRPGEISLVRTGLAVEIPEGFEMQIRARSGLAAKRGVFLVNGIGTIDSDYRGEIKIIMSTCGMRPVTLEAGERIAQGVIVKIERAQIILAEDLSQTLRGEGGFGSTDLMSSS
jgi:dUTP pyrophosphatase